MKFAIQYFNQLRDPIWLEILGITDTNTGHYITRIHSNLAASQTEKKTQTYIDNSIWYFKCIELYLLCIKY